LSNLHRFGCLIFLAGMLSTPAWGQFNPIELAALSRSVGQAGTQFDVRVASGAGTDEVDQLRFSDPRITAELKTLDPLPFTADRVPDYGNFQVKIAADTPPGRYELRAMGRHGVSHPRLFLVTAEASSIPATVSHQLASPTPLTLGETLQAHSAGSEIDYFSLDLKSGRRVRIELIAQRLDSRMIGGLKLHDPHGQIVDTARGSDQFDPWLDFTPELSGTYVLAVHDFLYRGGSEFFYLLIAGSNEEFATGSIDDINATRFLSPRAATVYDLAAAGVAETTAAAQPTDVSEPIDVAETDVQVITPPCALDALFESRRDEDVYEFAATEGDTFVIEVVSQRVGEPTDARVVVLRSMPQPTGEPTYQQVLTADDSPNVGGNDVSLGSKDPQVMFTAPATGNYRIVVRDLDTGEALGTAQRYTLVVRRPRPRVELVAYRWFPNKDVNLSRPFGSKIFRGGAESIRVLAVRQDGWSGPLEVAVQGLPPGVSAAPATIAAGQSETQLTLVASEEAGSWTGPIEVVATASVAGKETTTRAHVATLLSGRGHSREFIRSRLCNELMICVAGGDLAPISAAIGDATVVEGKKNSSLKLPIRLTRRDGGNAACVLRPRDLPPGVTAAEVNVAADKSEGTLELKIAAGAVAGTYSLWLQMETKIKVPPNPQFLERARKYRTHLQSLHDDPAQAEKIEAIRAAIQSADERIKAAEPQGNAQELSVYIPSPPVTIRVVDP
jgi:hypothetical protein